MICLRCGYCCFQSFVIIVDDPSIGIREKNLVEKPTGERCKHLDGDEPGKMSCRIHSKRWYKRTPCFQHGQIEAGNTNCRMGEYVLKNKIQYARNGK